MKVTALQLSTLLRSESTLPALHSLLWARAQSAILMEHKCIAVETALEKEVKVAMTAQDYFVSMIVQDA